MRITLPVWFSDFDCVRFLRLMRFICSDWVGLINRMQPWGRMPAAANAARYSTEYIDFEIFLLYSLL